MTFYIQKVKGRVHCDVTMFCKNTFLAVIQPHNEGKEEEIVTISHIGWMLLTTSSLVC